MKFVSEISKSRQPQSLQWNMWFIC